MNCEKITPILVVMKEGSKRAFQFPKGTEFKIQEEGGTTILIAYARKGEKQDD